MPLAFIDSGNQTGQANVGGRSFIPGIEPGGSRAGEAMKPVLLIRDAWAELVNVADSNTNADFQENQVRLVLSQEIDMTPGLLLPVAEYRGMKTATANLWNGIDIDQTFHAQGSIWAARVVGVQVSGFVGGMDTIRWKVFIDYEKVEVPWMDWFLMWDFLDNVANDSFEY